MKRKFIAGILCCMIVCSMTACGTPAPDDSQNISGSESISGEVETDTNVSTPAPESNQQTNTESTDTGNVDTNTTDKKDPTSSTEQNTATVVPIYFEGDRAEILRQKVLLGRDNYYRKVSDDYYEMVLGVTDINNFDYLFQTDKKYYTQEDFSSCSDDILKLAKNEIYARHGRMFVDKELYEYFLTRMWYEPQYTPEDFDDGCLNDYERANLKILIDLGA